MYTLETFDEPQSTEAVELSCCIYNFAAIVAAPIDDEEA
jgi:hypothetical protein